MEGRNRPFRRLPGVVALSVLAAMSACTLFPAAKATPRSTYLLRPDLPPANTGARPCGPTTTVLLVSVPREEPGFDTSRIAYLLRPHALSYYADSRWADTPSRMLVPLLVRSLEETGCFGAVIPLPGASPGDFRLDIEDLAIVQEFTSRPSRVRFSLRALLVDARGQTVVAAQRFETIEAAPADDAYGGVFAANRAAGKAVGSLAEWVSAHVPRNPTAAPTR